MLTTIILLQNLKWLVPTTLMIGLAPAYLSVVYLWRILSAPLPSWVYVKGDDFMYSIYQRQLLFYFEVMSGMEIVYYGDLDAIDKVKNGENCIYMSNHQSTVDWVLANGVALRRGCVGRVRYVLKDGLRYLPWYGIYFVMHGSLLVKRAKKFSKDNAEKLLKKNAQDKKPMWMVVFPEGTRYNPDMNDVIAESQQFAKSQGQTPLNSVLFPRAKAMQICLEQLRGTIDSVYDVTLAYGKTFDYQSKRRLAAPTMQDVLLGLPKTIHVHIRRIPIAEVPYEEEEFKDWLYKRFQEKDRLLTQFYKSDSEASAKFEGVSKTHNLSLKSMFPSVLLSTGSLAAIYSFKQVREFYGKLALGTAFTGILLMALKR